MLSRKLLWLFPIFALVIALALMSAGLADAQEGTGVLIDKVWDGTVGENVTIEVWDDSGDLVGVPCSLSDVTTCLVDVSPGTYTVIETSLPAGSTLVGYNPSDGDDADGTTFEVASGQTVTVIVTNTLQLNELPDEISVGGVTEFLVNDSGSSYVSIALLASAAAAVVAVATGGWFARKRWLADRS